MIWEVLRAFTGKARARLGNFQHILFVVFRATGSYKADLQLSIAVLAAEDILCDARCEEKVRDKSRCEPSPKAGWVQVKLFNKSSGGNHPL